jgi:DNA-binding YbaB/EbfC family protein
VLSAECEYSELSTQNSVEEGMEMKLPGGFDLQEMMQQAKQMQEHLQREMQQVRVEASVGGGIVSVSMNGAKELVDLRIDPETVKNGDVEMLQDLIIAAVNEASRKADEAMKGKLGSQLGGMGLPDDLL